MTYKEALAFDQKWTAKQAFNDLERYLLREEKPAMKAVAVGMQALEKQMPKKPIEVYYPKHSPSGCTFYGCPQCKNSLSRTGFPYCEHCGQALKWR